MLDLFEGADDELNWLNCWAVSVRRILCFDNLVCRGAHKQTPTLNAWRCLDLAQLPWFRFRFVPQFARKPKCVCRFVRGPFFGWAQREATTENFHFLAASRFDDASKLSSISGLNRFNQGG